jgi:acyl carrier protein
MGMSDLERITQAIYDAIDQVNESPGFVEPVEKAPETVLFGESGKLDSLSFVTFVTVVEENLQRFSDATISVMDAVGTEPDPCTVATLAKRLAEMLGSVGKE